MGVGGLCSELRTHAFPVHGNELQAKALCGPQRCGHRSPGLECLKYPPPPTISSESVGAGEGRVGGGASGRGSGADGV